MKLKTKKKLCSLSIALSIVTILGSISYAFFAGVAEVRNPESANVSTGSIRVTFADNDDGVRGRLDFDESITKKFTIENTGTLDAQVKMYWRDLVNKYIYRSLTYTLEYSEKEEGPYTKIVEKENIPRSVTPTKQVLADSLTIPAGVTYYYNLVITLNTLEDMNQLSDLSATFSARFVVENIDHEENIITLVNGLKVNIPKITTYGVGEKTEMYAFDHTEATQTTVWSEEERRDYRYIGNNPNNYIEFNDEVWRIIGVFTIENEAGKKEQLIKIIRNESIGDLAWEAGNNNDWLNSSLYKLLNDNYYNQTGSYTSSGAVKGLSDQARKQVANVKWYLGGTNTASNLGGPNYYDFERSNAVYSGRKTSVIQRVGLLYPSDYVYTYAYGVNDRCYTAGLRCDSRYSNLGWLYIDNSQWTQSPTSYESHYTFFIDKTGFVSYTNTTEVYGIRPTVYLSDDIQIMDGDGSQVNPYKLK